MIIIRILKYSLITFGCICFVLIFLCFTSAPFWSYYWLATKNAGIHRPPDYIIVLGGGGMPSETALMRIWYAAKAASRFSRSKIIIALPGDTTDNLSSVNLMKDELILRGIDRSRIMLEPLGTNTRSEALDIWRMICENRDSRNSRDKHNSDYRPPSIAIVTSPEHLNRAVHSFKKAGFIAVDGLPAFESDLESDLTYNDRTLGGRKWIIPGIGGNIILRYQFWTQLHYEELIIREMFATVYYRLKGWI
jgi:uncharacterized SAM-binding protein YcdF (DUF218 family)